MAHLYHRETLMSEMTALTSPYGSRRWSMSVGESACMVLLQAALVLGKVRPTNLALLVMD